MVWPPQFLDRLLLAAKVVLPGNRGGFSRRFRQPVAGLALQSEHAKEDDPPMPQLRLAVGRKLTGARHQVATAFSPPGKEILGDSLYCNFLSSLRRLR